MKTFVRYFSKLPLSGKPAISDLFFKFLKSKTKPEQEKSFAYLMALLVIYIFGHGVQAFMGYEALFFGAPFLANIVFGLYALINVCAVITQVYLAFRATGIFLKGKLLKTNLAIPKFKISELVTMLVITLGGQIIFMVLYSMPHIQ